MEHSSSVLALAGALLLAGGGDSRLERVTSGSFAERSPAAVWSRAVQLEQSSKSLRETRRGVATQGVEATSGRVSLLTYNVAGLPGLVSHSDPEVNIPLISPLLNHYDIALVQEDFSYHARLSARAEHAYRSEPMSHSLALVADGLNWFSRFPLGWIHRVRWAQCNGYVGAACDCLADKGFSFSEVTLAPGVSVDVYNVHGEAGASQLDMDVRRDNFEQLADYLRARSRDHAVIVAGDTNLRVTPEDNETLERFLALTGLTDACRRFGCGEERIDRVFFGSSARVHLEVLGWWTDRRFVDAEGGPLSDHPAVGVEVSWRTDAGTALVAGR
jgi:hypothetical protein